MILSAPFGWNLPKGLPQPHMPANNPMSAAKIRLGRFLFYDKRMSVNGGMSCGSCHLQELAFTDGKALAVGATGQRHLRSAMSLVNVAYATALTWNNPGLQSLEKQALAPMFSSNPIELGVQEAEFLKILRYDIRYRSLFQRAFPGKQDPLTIANVARAIAAFERTIVSARSPLDRYRYDADQSAISDSAKRGEVLFFTDQSGACFRCHSGFNFTDGGFHDTGLNGKFRTPTLRNVALTAPYMHDGSIATLEGVLDHYAAGGREAPNKDRLLKKLSLSTQNRKDLIAFLESLTDEQLTRDPRFSDPW